MRDWNILRCLEFLVLTESWSSQVDLGDPDTGRGNSVAREAAGVGILVFYILFLLLYTLRCIGHSLASYSLK